VVKESPLVLVVMLLLLLILFEEENYKTVVGLRERIRERLDENMNWAVFVGGWSVAREREKREIRCWGEGRV